MAGCSAATPNSTRAHAGSPARSPSRGIKRGDTVSAVLANTPAMLECHYGVPMTGAVLNTINTRLDAAVVAFQLDHAEAKVLIVDREFSKLVKEALALAKAKPLVIDYDDPEFTGAGERLGTTEYEDFIATGDADFAWSLPRDEWDAISLNYTSGTTGDPKGVVYHHRGASLLAVGNVLTGSMGKHCVYLWTLPMFHCNGWCFPWTISVVAGTHVCLRQVRAPRHVRRHRRAQGDASVRRADRDGDPARGAGRGEEAAAARGRILHRGGAAARGRAGGDEGRGLQRHPSLRADRDLRPRHRQRMADGLGRAAAAEQAAKKARQGVRYVALEALDVRDPDTMAPVPRDGESMGEVMFRGNVVMKGYLKNKAATEKAFAGGWFHSGDLGVIHPDGYIQLKDRSKDIIISGGENISSIEVEDALYKHPAVQAAAVVAKPDDKWGETPVRLRRAQARATSATQGRSHRLVPQESRQLQVPALRRVRRAAQDLHRQGAEVQAARDGEGGVRGLRARSWKARTQSMRLIRVMRAKMPQESFAGALAFRPPLQPG